MLKDSLWTSFKGINSQWLQMYPNVAIKRIKQGTCKNIMHRNF